MSDRPPPITAIFDLCISQTCPVKFHCYRHEAKPAIDGSQKQLDFTPHIRMEYGHTLCPYHMPLTRNDLPTRVLTEGYS